MDTVYAVNLAWPENYEALRACTREKEDGASGLRASASGPRGAERSTCSILVYVVMLWYDA